MAVEEETIGLMAHMRFGSMAAIATPKGAHTVLPPLHAYIQRTDERDGI